MKLIGIIQLELFKTQNFDISMIWVERNMNNKKISEIVKVQLKGYFAFLEDFYLEKHAKDKTKPFLRFKIILETVSKSVKFQLKCFLCFSCKI